MLDGTDRRAWTSSLVLHGLLVGVVLMPPWWRRALVPHLPPPPPPAPAHLRLVLAPTPLPPPPPLPPLAPQALRGWSALGVAPALAPVAVPRASGSGSSPSSADTGSARAPVRLPTLHDPHLQEAIRIDGRPAPAQQLAEEQMRLADAATLLEQLIRDRLHGDWATLVGPVQHRALFLGVVVDARGTVVSGRRLTSTGSTHLDEAIDRWLRDPESPLGLPPIQPGVEHVLRVEPYGP